MRNQNLAYFKRLGKNPGIQNQLDNLIISNRLLTVGIGYASIILLVMKEILHV